MGVKVKTRLTKISFAYLLAIFLFVNGSAFAQQPSPVGPETSGAPARDERAPQVTASSSSDSAAGSLSL